MNGSTLEISPPRRSFLFVFLIAGILFLMNGFAVLLFSHAAPIPEGLQPGQPSPSFGIGSAPPIVAGLLCLAAAGWMLLRHRKIARIAELVRADLPHAGTTPSSREKLLYELADRADHLRNSLFAFPEAAVSLFLDIDSSHQLNVEFSSSGTLSGRLSPADPKLVSQIEKFAETVALEDEVLIELGNASQIWDFVNSLSTDILRLPPDFELSGDVHVYKRDQA